MDPPELTNFGSLLRFALALEDAAAAFYTELAAGDAPGTAVAVARELADRHRERHRILERTRRHVNEMILEPIVGLDGRRYLFDATPGTGLDAVRRGVALEETAAAFYLESSDVAKALLAEAARTFRRFGEESARDAVRLRIARSAGAGEPVFKSN